MPGSQLSCPVLSSVHPEGQRPSRAPSATWSSRARRDPADLLALQLQARCPAEGFGWEAAGPPTSAFPSRGSSAWCCAGPAAYLFCPRNERGGSGRPQPAFVLLFMFSHSHYYHVVLCNLPWKDGKTSAYASSIILGVFTQRIGQRFCGIPCLLHKANGDWTKKLAVMDIVALW